MALCEQIGEFVARELDMPDAPTCFLGSYPGQTFVVDANG